MAEELVQDMILQAVMLVLIGLSLVLAAVNNADSTQYFLRFYAKDLGTITDAVLNARGEVELSYRSIRPQDQFIFDFEPHYVRLSAQPVNESTRIRWRVLQYYGTPAARPELELIPHTLYQPFSITFSRNPSQLRFDNNPGPACAGAENALRKEEAYVTVQGSGSLFVLVKQQLTAEGLTTPPSSHPHRIFLSIRELALAETETATIAAGGSQSELAEDLACLLRIALEPHYNVSQAPPLNAGEITVSLTFPSIPPQDELKRNSTTQAITAALEAFLQ